VSDTPSPSGGGGPEQGSTANHTVGRFADRRDAGRRLARRLASFADLRPVVVGVSRGGVPVAAEVADRLGAPLDVIVVGRIETPWPPKLGLGAIAEGGVCVLDLELIAELHLVAEDLGSVIHREGLELTRRVRRYRAGAAAVTLSGRDVVVVDDGVATGATASAAIEAVRRSGAEVVILAVPVAPIASASAMRTVADEVVTMERPPWFVGIGDYYRSFRPVTDEEVVAHLTRDAAARRAQ